MKILILSLAATLLTQCTNAQSNRQQDRPKAQNATAARATKMLGNGSAANISGKHDTGDYATVYNTDDKKAVESMLTRFAGHDANPQSLVIAIARQLRGIPYVARTLENDSIENLVVNLRQLDCTTYVENVLAIYECVKNKRLTFADFCSYLRKLRYVDGQVSYPTRQHYFTEWIAENTKDGFVEEIKSPNPPFTAVQHLRINFMSTHASLYPMLKRHAGMIVPIAKMESRLSGKDYRYIPKGEIANSRLLRSTIHDGDIIAITTSKAGLDTSHIGIAVWHKDGLHMLNASQIHKKVVEEPMTLCQYMQKHPSQTGIRIVRIL